MKLYRHIYIAKAIPLLFLSYRRLELNNQSIKPTVERVSYIFYDSSIIRWPSPANAYPRA